jgi:hypothetical protein
MTGFDMPDDHVPASGNIITRWFPARAPVLDDVQVGRADVSRQAPELYGARAAASAPSTVHLDCRSRLAVAAQVVVLAQVSGYCRRRGLDERPAWPAGPGVVPLAWRHALHPFYCYRLEY